MLTLFQPYLTAIKLGAALVLLALAAWALIAYNEHERGIGRTEVQTAWDHANATATQARAARIERAHQTEAALQEAANDDRRKASEQKTALDARVAALTRELRNRPERPATTGLANVPAGPPGAGAASACTGAGLYRDDGVFLVGQARMCQDIRNQRDDYLRQYERARQKLKALGQEP